MGAIWKAKMVALLLQCSARRDMKLMLWVFFSMYNRGLGRLYKQDYYYQATSRLASSG